MSIILILMGFIVHEVVHIVIAVCMAAFASKIFKKHKCCGHDHENLKEELR